MRKKIMILGASELQLPAILKARELELESIVVDYDKNAVGASYADVFYNVSTLDYNKVLNIAIKENIDGILTICSDRPMNIVAKVSEKLGLNAISVEAAKAATNKALMREKLKLKNVPIPDFRICSTIEEYKKAIENIGIPCIVKPSDNSGSRGITFIENKDQISLAYEYAKNCSSEDIVLVEEYMYGEEVSVEVFVENNIVNIVQITDKITSGAPHFVEMGHTQPSSLSLKIQNEIKTVTEKAVKAIGICGGPVHVELKITQSGVKVVELGARLGGDFIATDLVLASTGVDMVKENILWALGDKVEIKKIFDRYAAIRYIGKLKATRLGNKELALLESFFWKRTQNIEIESSNDRECAFIVAAITKGELLRKIDAIREVIDYEEENYW